MDKLTSNDNGASPQTHRPEPDAHGQAAILLVESLIHGLVARAILSVSDALEIMQVAADVTKDIASEPGGPPTPLKTSLTILETMGASLRFDLPED